MRKNKIGKQRKEDGKWKKIIQKFRDDYGAEIINKIGLDYLSKEVPELAKGFALETGSYYDSGVLPYKYLEALWLGCCAVVKNTDGVKVHTQGCLTAGWKPKEIIHILYAASICCSHGIVSQLGEMIPILEGKKGRK
jgi:alkylhydroperoxidase/carboxymuconolactone decarboxylase family protein YurZ